jgi:hypothetical protein
LRPFSCSLFLSSAFLEALLSSLTALPTVCVASQTHLYVPTGHSCLLPSLNFANTALFRATFLYCSPCFYRLALTRIEAGSYTFLMPLYNTREDASMFMGKQVNAILDNLTFL